MGIKDGSKSNRSLTRFGTIAVFSAATIGMLHPIVLWWHMFSGDAEIHLAYARNLLRGYPLQFNLNMPNSGETSMGYLLVVSLIMKVFGEALTPLVIKVVCLLAFYLTAVATYLVAKETGISRPWREIAAILVLWLPGNAYVAMYGTENILFAAMTCFFVYAAIRAKWFDLRGSPSISSDLILGLAAGTMFWFRPETIPIMGMLLFFRFAAAIVFRRSWRLEALRAGSFSLVLAVAVCAYVAIFKHYAGEIPFGAGKARLLISLLKECVIFHGVPIDLKVLTRIASYFSIVVPALLVGIVALTRSYFSPVRRLQILAYSVMIFGFFSAYTFNFLPAVHFARYSVFVWPFALILAVLGLQAMFESRLFSRRVSTFVSIALLLCLLGTSIYETRLRIALFRPGPPYSLDIVASVPQQRDPLSAAIAAKMGIPTGAHATVAFQEVQLRYELNDNFTIVSLDGITDSRLVPYFCNKWIDHDGYLIDTKVDYVVEFPNYNADKSKWALADLLSIKVGESLTRPGIVYTRIQPLVVKVHRTVNAGSERPGGNCPTGS